MATALSPSWGRALRIGVPLVIVGTVAALRPEIVTGTFSSAGSVLRVVALVVVWTGFSWLVRRLVRQPVARTAIVAVAGIGLLWLTVVPYFQEETVDDPFPTVAAAAAPAADPAANPASSPASTPASSPASTPATPAPPVAAEPQPQKVGAGQLRGLAGHRGSGEAAVYRQPDGSLLVRLEEFDVSSVPAPVVYLVPGAGRESPGGVKLGGLRGSQGNQNFAVPAGTQVTGSHTVLIWCEAFSVPVAGATAAIA